MEKIGKKTSSSIWKALYIKNQNALTIVDLCIKCVYPVHLPTCSHTSVSLLTGATQGVDHAAAKLDKIMQVIFSPYRKTLEQSLAEFN